ncbi:MAG TPA: ethanolamine ammonia-lyase subunit EutB [Pirellulales bacterium]
MRDRELKPLTDINVPPQQPERNYSIRVGGRDFHFRGLKALLGAADCSKAGDRNAHLAAADELEREAARALVSDLTLAHVYEHPLVDEAGGVDSVMRANYDLDPAGFERIANWTLGELKNYLLRENSEDILPIGRALTGVMAAALAKICDVHELVLLARKMPRGSRARTTLGLPGTLASRLQPNHPTDDPRGITLLTWWGWSMGAGDALVGLNPAIDTVDNASATLVHLDKLRRAAGVPTQICVLSHIKTQLACLARGAPVEILFQSLAGTESTLTSEFDVTVDLLDLGYETMRKRGALADTAQQWMYFETGQGSEFTYAKHNGMDMATAEALCYGLARRYDPFMVNNVTGFIGPETHLGNFEMIISNLQDHFMGKLLGLPMGMAPCYTLHSQITLEGQQMATQLLTAAGANYYMDVALNTDRMLAYFDTSAHDDQTLREIYDREPAPEFAAWAIERGIFERDATGRVVRGSNWGNPRLFGASEFELQDLLRVVPALPGFESAGPRPVNRITRQVRADQAVGREAIHAELDLDYLAREIDFRVISTQAATKEAHLNSPELGARLSADSRRRMQPEKNTVQILISDGLSAEAVHHNAAQVVRVLLDALASRNVSCGRTLVARYGRVKLAEEVGAAIEADLVVHLLGERPGGDAQAARSLSAYLVYRVPGGSGAPADGRSTFEYTVVSNIHQAGLPPVEAGAVVAEKAFQILQLGAAGNRLEQMLNSGRT